MVLYQKMENTGTYFIASLSAKGIDILDKLLDGVEMAKKSGADCVLFHTYIPEIKNDKQEKKNFENNEEHIWECSCYQEEIQAVSLPVEWHVEVKERCREMGLDFLCAPHSISAVSFLEEIGIEMYKVDFGELTNQRLIRYMASKEKEMFIPCDLEESDELKTAYQYCMDMGNTKIITLQYVCQEMAEKEKLSFSAIKKFPGFFLRGDYLTGLCDDSFGLSIPLLAAREGIYIVEKRFQFDRGSRERLSIYLKEDRFQRMVQYVRGIREVNLELQREAQILKRKKRFSAIC